MQGRQVDGRQTRRRGSDGWVQSRRKGEAGQRRRRHAERRDERRWEGQSRTRCTGNWWREADSRRHDPRRRDNRQHGFGAHFACLEGSSCIIRQQEGDRRQSVSPRVTGSTITHWLHRSSSVPGPPSISGNRISRSPCASVLHSVSCEQTAIHQQERGSQSVVSQRSESKSLCSHPHRIMCQKGVTVVAVISACDHKGAG